jgi:hypothetical protein
MKHILTCSVLFLFFANAKAQAKIGGTPAAPDASAVLELDGGNSRGLLLPRMRKMDIDAILNPAEGLTIYATDEQAVYLRRSNNWVKMNADADVISIPYYRQFDHSGTPVFGIANTANNGVAIHGQSIGNGYGVRGFTQTGIGLNGISQNLSGVGGYFANNEGGRSLVSLNKTGIGTVSPDVLLHIDGTTSTGSTVVINDDDDPTIQFRKAGVNVGLLKNASLYMESSNSEGSFNWIQSSAPLTSLMGLRRKSGINGKGVLNVSTGVSVGSFGGEFPSATLHVRGTPGDYNYTMLLQQTGGDPLIALQNDGLDKGFIQLVANDLKLGTYSTNDPGRVILRTNGSDRLWVDSVGYVTIGGKTGSTVSGPYKLAVKGKIAATDSWPDYVFADNYKLSTLEETETFIKSNKHLPNIPAASVVEKEGFALGEMQKMMMEKIEELTLHLKAANKSITALSASRTEDKTEIALLKKQMLSLQKSK